MSSVYSLMATTQRGLEGVLKAEVRRMGGRKPAIGPGRVRFSADEEGMLEACLRLRTASRVLQVLGTCPAPDVTTLYRAVHALDWPRWVAPTQTIALRVTTIGPSPLHPKQAMLKIKDALVDRIRDACGARPNIDRKHPDVRLIVMLEGEDAILGLDLVGDSLHKRYYRTQEGPAPLKEHLAAGLLLLSGWRPGIPLEDPFCGTGTIVIEAAMIAAGMAPGLGRRFALEGHRMHTASRRARLEALRARIADERRAVGSIHLRGVDRDPRMVDIARLNAERAGVASMVSFDVGEMKGWRSPAPRAWVITNPPYGVRLKAGDERRRELYAQISEGLSAAPLDRAWILAADPGIERAIRRPVSERHRLFNGPIEVWAYRFDAPASGGRASRGRRGPASARRGGARPGRKAGRGKRKR